MVHAKLSARESQILALAAEGHTDQSISHTLGISLATIGTYWGRIRMKLGPLGRPELVANYVRELSAASLEELRRKNELMAKELESHLSRQEELQATLQTFQSVLDGAPDAIMLVNPDGQILRANHMVGDLFGYQLSEFVGMRIGQLMPPELHDRHRQHRESYINHPTRFQMGDHAGLPARGKQGNDFRIIATLNVVDTTWGPIVVCIVREVTGSLVPVAS